MNTPVVKHLLALDSPLHKRYLSTYYCNMTITQAGGRVQSRYCKRPWCKICNPIRAAIRINTYKDELGELLNLQFTTLTAPNVPGSEIRNTFMMFRKIFRQFRNTFKKRTGNVFKGVYSFEVTYNTSSRLYHPHVHITHEGLPVKVIVPNTTFKVYSKKEPGVLLYEHYPVKYVNELMEYFVGRITGASIYAQHTRICDDLLESFKYQTKPTVQMQINGKKETVIPVNELDTIYQQLDGVRCFQPFGIKATLTQDQEDDQMEQLTAYQVEKPAGEYYWNKHDWYFLLDKESGEIIELSGFVPNEKEKRKYEKLKRNDYYNLSG